MILKVVALLENKQLLIKIIQILTIYLKIISFALVKLIVNGATVIVKSAKQFFQMVKQQKHVVAQVLVRLPL